MPDKRFYKKLETVSEIIIDSYNKGLTLEQISKLHNCSPGTVRNLLLSNDVNLRSRGRRNKTV